MGRKSKWQLESKKDKLSVGLPLVKPAPPPRPIVSEPQGHWWRPLINRHVNGPANDGGRVRLIGLEVRITDPFGLREEIQMIPLNIELVNVCNASMQYRFGDCTLHTSVGDVNIPSVAIPPSGF